MLQQKRLHTVLLACLAAASITASNVSARGNGGKTKPVEHFKVGVKTVSRSGKVRVVRVGNVTRMPNGNVVAKGIPARRLDAMTDDLIRRWKRYRPPASVVVSEVISSDSGMRPAQIRHSFSFKKGDALYGAAVVRKFVRDNGYETLGLSVVKFIEYDSEASKAAPGEIIHDEPLKNFNFRKGTKIDYDYGDKKRIIIYKRVRPANNGKPMGVLRRSASNPRLAISQNHDAGTQEIGHLHIHKDGRITITPRYARNVFESDFGDFDKYDRDMSVSIIKDAKDWGEFKVALGSRLMFEAYVVEILEHVNFYSVSPRIDPVIFRP